MLVVAASAMIGAAMLQKPIESQRRRLKLTSVTADENIGKDPKTTLLQVAPGGLRAPLLTYLWLRSQQLKADGKFFDARQQRDLICDLMPHFPGVWSFHAWDMAWNISVATHTPEERWMWVSNGVRLLRDRGLYYNPDNLILHKELAWIFFSKMGHYTDEMHMTYKRRWAGIMHNVLGAPPFTDSADGAIEAFRLVTDAPKSLAKLKTDTVATDFIDRLAGCDVKPDEAFLTYYNLYSGDPSVSAPEWMTKEPADEKDKEIAHLMRAEEFAAARAKVLAFVRRKVLVEQYRMDPNWMLDLMERYGPMDWRSVNSHAIYWSTLGLHRSEGKGLGEINALNTDRTFLGGLKSLTRTGQIYYTHSPNIPEEPYVDFLPDWRFVEPTHREYLIAERILVRKPTGEPGEIDSLDNLLRDGHITYLSNAVQQMYFGGREDMARKYYGELKDTLKATGEIYKLDLHGFVREKRRRGGAPTVEMSKALMAAALRSAYRALAGGNHGEYLRFKAVARRSYNDFLKDVAGKARLQPPPFGKIEQNFLVTMLVQPRAVGLNVPLITKANLYNTLTPRMRQELFPLIADRLRKQCQAEEIDFDKAFPTPPGVGSP
ncbi:MAG: hypothetical protein K8R91_04540 [Phycisphaerae bacterium]|nr:hypothetical protein [Phycisphaerae bacterium]